MTIKAKTLDRIRGMLWGAFIGDALAMPVHWYYNRKALFDDYGEVRDYVAPRNPHPSSILWRSKYEALNPRGEILHEQAGFWGQRDIHYHQFLQAGENTLNLQLALVLADSLSAAGCYSAPDHLADYIEFMTTPGRHRDTYIEECHREFFTRLARGRPPEKCGGPDIHIGGLSSVAILCAWAAGDTEEAVRTVSEHVSLTHRSRETLEAAETTARMLCDLILGNSMADTLSAHAADWLPPAPAGEWLRQPDGVVVGQRFSTACYIQDAFPATLYLALKYAESPEAGLIANTNLGGDNCHRGAVLGALLGASGGMTAFPENWKQGLLMGERLDGFVSAVQSRQS